jgi:hypothetical protein
MQRDTIVALATPAGVSAIAVVRISGPLSQSLFCHFTFKDKFSPKTLYHCKYLSKRGKLKPRAKFIVQCEIHCWMLIDRPKYIQFLIGMHTKSSIVRYSSVEWSKSLSTKRRRRCFNQFLSNSDLWSLVWQFRFSSDAGISRIRVLSRPLVWAALRDSQFMTLWPWHLCSRCSVQLHCPSHWMTEDTSDSQRENGPTARIRHQTLETRFRPLWHRT